MLHQIKAQDAAFLYLESGNNFTHVTAVSIFDPATAPEGTVRFKDIIAHVETRVHASPIFRRRLVHVPFELDYPYWVDDEYFDIEYHIGHARLPAPGDWRQLCIHLARYHSRPLNMNRPPWEMYVVEGLDNVDRFPPGSYALVVKIHHVAVDGASAMRFFAALADKDANGTPFVGQADVEATASDAPDLPTMVGRAVLNNLTSPVRMANTMLQSAPMVVNGLRNALMTEEADEGVPHTRFNVSVSPHKMFDAAIFSLDDFRKIRSLADGATINDVVLAVCAGGLRRYLEFHDELPTDPLIAWVPINARPRGSASDASGNNITAMTAAIHTDIKEPVERLKAIHRTTRATKEAKAGVSARLMTDLSQHAPAATQALAGRLVSSINLNRRVCNLFVSNVPGPQTTLYMNGAKQIGSFGMAPLNNGMGLFIATPSYDGMISFGVTSTREIMPDIAYFIDCLQGSFNELLQLAAPEPESRRKPKSARRGPRKASTQPDSESAAGNGGPQGAQHAT